MNKLSRRHILCSVAALALSFTSVTSFAANALDSIEKAKVLRVAIPADTAPFGFVGPDMQPEGLDVDMAKLVAKSLGVKVKLVPVTSENRVAYLLAHKVDIVISTLAKNEARAKVIDFTEKYSPYYQAVYGEKSIKVKDWADLAGKKIGVPRGSIEDQTVTAKAPSSAEIMRFSDQGATAAALSSGQVQFVATGSAVVAALLQKNPNLPVDFKLLMKDSPNYIGVNKGEPELLNKLNSIIDENTKNGTLDQLAHKWLGQFANKPGNE